MQTQNFGQLIKNFASFCFLLYFTLSDLPSRASTRRSIRVEKKKKNKKNDIGYSYYVVPGLVNHRHFLTLTLASAMLWYRIYNDFLTNCLCSAFAPFSLTRAQLDLEQVSATF